MERSRGLGLERVEVLRRTHLHQNCTISAVVCTRNRGDRIVATVNSILANTHPSFELLIVDQSTNDITEKALSPFLSDSRVRYISSKTVGAGKSRQIGLLESKADLIAFTDDDCTVPPDWLSTFESIFLINQRVAVAFCNVIATNHDTTTGFVPSYERKDEVVVNNMWRKCQARGIGAGMAVRRSIALNIGGFDSLLGPGAEFPACEDGDIAVRALLKGWWVYETAQVAVLHDGFRTWQEGKELNRRNWIGVGAAYAKPIKCNHWDALLIVAYEAFVISFLKPLSRIFLFRKPQGIRGFYYFWKGFLLGLKTPVNCDYILYH